MNPPKSYPPAGMDRSEPVDRTCPLYCRRGHFDLCLRDYAAFSVRHLLMGCPSDCEDRERAKKQRAGEWEYIP